jgi:hypothetical protein
MLEVFTLTIVAFWPRVANASDLEELVKTKYQNQVLTLRRFYEGSKLRFDSKGQIVGEATAGSWTVDGQIDIIEIHLLDQRLQLKGRRVRLVFDRATSQMKDALGLTPGDALSKEFPQFGSKKWREFEKNAVVEVDLSLASAPKDENEIASAMNTVFLTPNDDLADFVPEFWKWFVPEARGQISNVEGRSYCVQGRKWCISASSHFFS